MVSFLAVDEGPCPSECLVSSGNDNIGICGVDDKVAHSPVFEVEDSLPCLSAVDCLIQAPLAVHLIVVELPFCGGIDNVRIFGIDGDLWDEIALLQADVSPILPPVYRFPHAVSMGAGAGMESFSCADIKDVRI